jgi:hypothetical protein
MIERTGIMHKRLETLKCSGSNNRGFYRDYAEFSEALVERKNSKPIMS